MGSFSRLARTLRREGASAGQFLSSETGLAGLAAVALGGLAMLWSAPALAIASAAGLLLVVWRVVRISAVRTQELHSRIGGLSRRVGDLAENVDDLGGRLDHLVERLDRVEGRVDEDHSRITESETAVEDLERAAVKRLRALETAVRLASESQHEQLAEARADADRQIAELETASTKATRAQADTLDARTSMLALAVSSPITHDEIDGVLMLMTIHRSGSTRLFDMLRTHPVVRLAPDMEVWSRLGLRGRRYPVAFSNTAGARVAIEVQNGEGAVIEQPEVFSPASAAGLNRWAVEKAHPQFADFDSDAFVTAASRMVDQGVRLRMVYGIRRPLEAMWSMVEFQRRQPSWQAWLPLEDFPDWIRRSLWSIVEIQEQLPGDVIDFVDLDGGKALHRLGLSLGGEWDERTAAEWVRHAVGQTDRSTRQQSPGTGFIGERDPGRSEAGPDGRWNGRLDVIADAERAYDLISQRAEAGLIEP